MLPLSGKVTALSTLTLQARGTVNGTQRTYRWTGDCYLASEGPLTDGSWEGSNGTAGVWAASLNTVP